ncbi:MAG: FISUMP domain-containing protein [Bacteroidota bacterium]
MKKHDSKGIMLPVYYVILILALPICFASIAMGQDTARIAGAKDTVNCNNWLVSNANGEGQLKAVSEEELNAEASHEEEDSKFDHPLHPPQGIFEIPAPKEWNGMMSPLTSCTNSDFSSGNFSNWSGCYGLWCADTLPTQTRCSGSYTPYKPPCTNTGMPWYNNPSGGHFTIQTVAMGNDPCITSLKRVFPGDAYSALIGNRACTSNGGYVDQLTYPIIYDPNNSFFIYRCAVVLANPNDPTHNKPDKRPRFTFEIKNHSTGLIVSSCGYYDLYPGDGITVWNTGPNNYLWKDWSTIGIDLKTLTGIVPGQQLDVVFTVHGCGFRAHTGYAYISTVCGSMNIDVAGCEGSGSVTLTGPPGFTTYQWDGPYCPTCTPTTFFGNPYTTPANTGDLFYLTLTALNGCQVQNVAQNIAFTSVTADFIVTGSSCMGQGTQFTDKSSATNHGITAWAWDFGDGGTSALQNPVHTFLAANTYTVTLTAYSGDGCPKTIHKQVTVESLPVPTFTAGDNSLCINSTGHVYSTEPGKQNYAWTIPPQASITAGGTSADNSVTLTWTASGTYTIKVNYTNPASGCTGATPTPYDVTVFDLPVPSFTAGDNSVCLNTSGHVYATQASKSLYTWTIPPEASITAGGTSTDNSVTLTWTTLGNYSISVNYTDPGTHCTAVGPTDFAVEVKPLPVPSFTAGDSPVCLNIPGHVYSTEASKSIYVWNIPPEATVTAGGTFADNSVTLTWNTAGNYGLSVNYTEPATTCTAATPTPFPVVVNSLPTPSFTTTDSPVCLNIPGRVYATEASKSGYVWTIPPEATVTAGGTPADNSVTLTWITPGIYALSVNYTEPSTACTAATPTPFSVTVNDLPIPSFTAGDNSVCLNIPGHVYTTEPTKSNYVWSIPPEASVTAGGTSADNSVTLTWNTVGNYSVGVNYTEPSTNCTAAAASTFAVEVKALPVPAFIAGDNSVCLNIPGHVYTTDPGKLSYVWNIPPQASVTAGGLSTDNSVTLTWTVNGSYNVGVNYTEPSTSCTAASATLFPVNVSTLPTPTFTAGENSVCLNTPGHSYVTQALKSNYVWNIPPEATITAGGTSADNSVTITWNTAGSYSLSVNYTEPGSSCTAAISTPFAVTVKSLPTPTFTAGDNSVCLNTSGHVYRTEAGKSNYIWTIPPQANITAGGTTSDNSVTLTWNTVGSFAVRVNYTEPATTCTAASSTPFNVVVNSLPVTTISSAAGPDCELQQHIYLTPVNPACTFTWSVIPGSYGNVGSGQGTNQATINWLLTGPATVSVTGINGSTGCTTSSSFPTTIFPSPSPTLTSCFDLVTTKNARAFVLKGGLPLLGQYQGSPGITYDAGTGLYWFNPASASVTQGSHQIRYFSQNSYGCSNISSAMTITVGASNTTFACGSNFTDPRNADPLSNKYPTTTFTGNGRSKCWMLKNFNWGEVQSADVPQTNNCRVEKYCLPTDASCTSYGGLYQWDELIQYGMTTGPDYQGVCPPGWHIPSQQDWQDLIDAVAAISPGDGLAGSYLKDQIQLNGFHALLNGIYYLNTSPPSFSTGSLTATMFWTSTSSLADPARSMARGLNSYNYSVSFYPSSRANAFPVRCVKD